MKKADGFCLICIICCLLSASSCVFPPNASEQESESNIPTESFSNIENTTESIVLTETETASVFPTSSEMSESDAESETDYIPVESGSSGNVLVRTGIAFHLQYSIDEGLAAVEKALGHEVNVIWKLMSANAVSVMMSESDFQTVRMLKEVRAIEKEQEVLPGDQGDSGNLAPVS